jgi:hypothetical protein
MSLEAVTAPDFDAARTIAETICSFLRRRQVDYHPRAKETA